ncbi:uncharacterized protein K489DRAFT_94236 [Dissoconium aciculare CBS 342.82]|uniref:Mid2 domain-containing protein n=1 Tax=Dissoconium aciculare CBS 342.82 TaxID=1314786 RepID=A0A6J3LUZ5_9PEZI|nr:uncharacterized protein K489DRAFT_94236 [Dissoconium aciculare CBS 342.82]KAF1818452.1 hypothetical protein K489DRAFT_94236 [Dissoconium aciculare CBS 342.82]
MAKLSLILPLLASWFIATACADCYWPDGTKFTDYPACDVQAKDGFSNCCGNSDMCTTNGFCKWNFFANSSLLWRNGCTDPSWNSPNCAQYCKTDRATGKLSNTPQLVVACSQTTYCCSTYAFNASALPTDDPALYSGCCSDPSAIFDAGVAGYLSGRKDFTTSQFPMTATSTASSSTSPTTRTSAPPSSSPSSSSSTGANSAAPSSQPSELTSGAKAGIGIGVAVAAVVAAALGAWLFLRFKARRRATASSIRAAEVHDVKEPVLDNNYYDSEWQAAAPPSELDSRAVEPAELPGINRNGSRRELP